MSVNNRINANLWRVANVNANNLPTGIKNVLTGGAPPTTAPTLYPAMYVNTSDKTIWYNVDGSTTWVQALPPASSLGGGGFMPNQRIISYLPPVLNPASGTQTNTAVSFTNDSARTAGTTTFNVTVQWSTNPNATNIFTNGMVVIDGSGNRIALNTTITAASGSGGTPGSSWTITLSSGLTATLPASTSLYAIVPQTWSAPVAGKYLITAIGAGGSGGVTTTAPYTFGGGGAGGLAQSVVTLTSGQTLTAAIGKGAPALTVGYQVTAAGTDGMPTVIYDSTGSVINLKCLGGGYGQANRGYATGGTGSGGNLMNVTGGAGGKGGGAVGVYGFTPPSNPNYLGSNGNFDAGGGQGTGGYGSATSSNGNGYGGGSLSSSYAMSTSTQGNSLAGPAVGGQGNGRLLQPTGTPDVPNFIASSGYSNIFGGQVPAAQPGCGGATWQSTSGGAFGQPGGMFAGGGAAITSTANVTVQGGPGGLFGGGGGGVYHSGYGYPGAGGDGGVIIEWVTSL